MVAEYPVRIKYFEDHGSVKGVTGGSSKGGSSASSKKDAKKNTANIGKMAKGIAVVAAAVAAIATALKPLLDFVSAIFALLTTLLAVAFQPFFEEIADTLEAFSDFLSGNISLEDLVDTMRQQIKDVTGAFVAGVIETGKGLFTALFETVKIIIFEYFNSAMESMKTAVAWVSENVLIPAITWVAEQLTQVWDEFIQPAWESLKNLLGGIWDTFLKPAWDTLSAMISSIFDTILRPVWDTLAEKIAGAWGILKGAFSSLANKISGFLANLFSFGGGGRHSGSSGGRAFGGIIPEDGLYLMHAGETVSRGNTTSSTTKNFNPIININVGGGSRDVDRIARELSRELSLFGRL